MKEARWVFTGVLIILLMLFVGDVIFKPEKVYCKYRIYSTDSETVRDYTSSVQTRQCEDRIYEASRQYWKVIGQTTENELHNEIKAKVVEMSKWERK